MTIQPKSQHHFACFLLVAIFIFVTPYTVWAFMAPTSRDTPESITIGDKKISLKSLKNPLPSSPETTQEGGEIYIKNCLLCHGDLLDGKGIFGESFFPAPA
ncbi:MAG: hypothetical protein HN465_02650, partial [Nitrospina sp.]|nr:hypothetical protein [Nitrospina sp.]